jgi:hypothetical protein
VVATHLLDNHIDWGGARSDTIAGSPPSIALRFALRAKGLTKKQANGSRIIANSARYFCPQHVDQTIEEPQLGFLGKPRTNALRLNRLAPLK